MKTPNRVGYQLSQELRDILNHGNRLIELNGADVPSHRTIAVDWDNDGDVEIELYTTKSQYEKMIPALDNLCNKLKEKGYLRKDSEKNGCDGKPWKKYENAHDEKYEGEFEADHGVVLKIMLQHVPITVRDKKGAKLRVLEWEEYSKRLWAVKVKATGSVLRMWITDGHIETHPNEWFKERYEWMLCLQNDVEYIQSILDKKEGEGKYVALTSTYYPRDRRRRVKTQNTFYPREGLTVRRGLYDNPYEAVSLEGTCGLSAEEFERLKSIGIPEQIID